jgi:CO/xanthine dehydrogenase FAD-binding subunit
MHEVKPIDDIRSTADYRRQVAANLLDEFLQQLHPRVAPEETA